MKALKKLALICALASPAAIYAEDIEVYVGSTTAGGSKPKVLFILDNSGSMNESVTTPEGYDNTFPYDYTGAGSGFKDDYIFYSVGVPIDDIVLSDIENRSDAKRFNSFINGCDAAKEAISKYGYFTGKMLEFAPKGNGGEWVNIKNDNGGNMNSAVDCLADFLADDDNNRFDEFASMEAGVTSIQEYLNVRDNGKDYTSASDDALLGFPSNTKVTSGNTKFLGYSGADWASNSDYSKEEMEAIFANANVVTLYSPNYVRWYINKENNQTSQDKIEVAKETIRRSLGATQDAEFGLMLYNLNFPQENRRDGGRVVANFGNDENIVDIISSIEGETNTPLCESLYEAYNFLAGNAVQFGDDDVTCNSESGCQFNYDGNSPAFDLSTTVGGAGEQYQTPYVDRGGCDSNINIIYITDGTPTLDAAADESIAALWAAYSGSLTNDDPTPPDLSTLQVDGSFMPALAHILKNYDLADGVSGKQTATLYTVGFGSDAPEAILDAAATQGGGKYYFAKDGESLDAAINETLNVILSTSTSFTAPSVASNNFDRTQTSDSVYYAMFLPTEGTRWAGNLKKLKVSGGVVIDSKGNPALDAEGNIKSEGNAVTTFWSGAPDGNDVRAGGANYVLGQGVASDRTMFSNIGDGGALTKLSASGVASFYGGEDQAASKLGIPSGTLTELISWTYGVDVDDDNNNGVVTDTRQDILGDPLHSRPVALTYPDGEVKIIMGTNAGFVHLFSDKGTSLTEQWSFIPNELLENLPTLRANDGGQKVYGMDGTASVYFKDANNNGIVDEGTDTVWVFIGMRRGGYSYYALDISNSSAPRLMWTLDSSTPGMGQLGQTWSKPVITYLKEYGDEPILVFGAGYDTNKDNSFSADNIGRGVYLVKASDRTIVGKFTNENAASGIFFPGFHSIVGEVSVLDSDYDGYTDRMYASDTGGNVWRFDMPGDISTWSVFKFAELSSVLSDSDKRHFYYGPSVARTYYTHVETDQVTVDGETTTTVSRQERPFEAVLVGSGNRSHPLETSVDDYLYMLRDTYTKTQTFGLTNTPSPIKHSELMDITDEPFYDLEFGSDAFISVEEELSGFKGWKYKLGAAEKSLAEPDVLFGVAYFSSFTPSEGNNIEKCQLEGGEGRLYLFNLQYGSRVLSSLTIDLGNKIPPSPTWVVEEEFYCLNCGSPDVDPNPGKPGGLIVPPAIDEEDGVTVVTPSFRTLQNYIYRREETN
ncbi:pilus assembly protein [Pseudoalteromonas pernae]|uniref:pilus assembly protein n=1 Tax=Pseudoalteromonas pernae TaxID=3118054 RepID=UPI003242AAAA